MAAIKRTSTGIVRCEPRRRTWRFSRTRSSFGCRSLESSPSSSRKIVPPSACSKTPGREPMAPDDEGAARPPALAMDGLGDQLLAGPRLALDEQGDIRCRDAGEVGEELAHPCRAAEEVAIPVRGGLLAIHRLGKRLHDEHGVAQLELNGGQSDGVVDADSGQQDAVGRSFVPDAHAAAHRLDRAVAPGDGVVRENEVVVGGGADAQGAADDIAALPCIGALGDGYSGLAVADDSRADFRASGIHFGHRLRTANSSGDHRASPAERDLITK